MTGVWVTNDVISATRMNEKTIFQGSGSTINGLTTYAGMLVYCTSSGSGFQVDNFYVRNSTNTSWSIFYVDKLPYLPLSTTIGDYTSPNAAVASSVAGGTNSLDINNNNNANPQQVGGGGGAYNRIGVKFTSSSAHLNKVVDKVSFWLKKTGSPTGTASVVIRNSAGTIKQTIGTLDVSTLTGSYAWYDFTSSNPLPVTETDDRIEIVFTGGSGGNLVDVGYDAGARYDGVNTHASVYVSSYTDSTGADVSFRLYTSVNTASYVYDGNTGTAYTSADEANPNIYVDLSGSTREIVGIALNINKTTTTVTSLKIRASTDTSFADAENVAYVNISDFTDDTWRFLAINFLADNRRYVQIYANETGVLSINEIKVRYGVSDTVKILTHKHRTRNVSAADSFTDSN